MNSSTALRVLRQRCSPVRRITTSRSYATKQSGSAVGNQPLLMPLNDLLLIGSPQAQFYKTFTRPIGKVLVLAVFTYQVAYWTWTKLEADEARAEADGEFICDGPSFVKRKGVWMVC